MILNVVLEILDIFSDIFKDWEVFWKSSDFLGRSWKVWKRKSSDTRSQKKQIWVRKFLQNASGAWKTYRSLEKVQEKSWEAVAEKEYEPR